MRYLLCVVSIALLGTPSQAVPIILEMGTSARAVGMGGAFTAIADDESAVFYNPAGLAFLSKLTVSAFYQRAFDVVHHIALTAASSGWGAQVIRIDTGPLESTNEFGNPSGEPMPYASQAGLVGIAFGREYMALGLRGKLSSDGTETSWGLDAGALARLGGLRVGIVAEDLLGMAELSLRAGMALEVQVSPRIAVTIALEGWNLLSSPELHLGLEVSVNGVHIRVGYDGVAVITGAGARWNSIRLDWAYRMHPQLPASAIVTVAYLF